MNAARVMKVLPFAAIPVGLAAGWAVGLSHRLGPDFRSTPDDMPIPVGIGASALIGALGLPVALGSAGLLWTGAEKLRSQPHLGVALLAAGTGLGIGVAAYAALTGHALTAGPDSD